MVRGVVLLERRNKACESTLGDISTLLAALPLVRCTSAW